MGLYVTIVVMTTHSFDNSDFNAGDENGASNSIDSNDAEQQALRDIADVPAVEIISSAAVHLMSAAAVKCGLA